MRWSSRGSAVLVMLLCSLTLVRPVANAVDVGSDDANDQFVGGGDAGSSSGGSSGSGRHSCANCTWMASDPCSSQFNSSGCGQVAAGCPAGQEKRRLWFSLNDGLTWLDRGLRCVDTSSRDSVDPAGRILHETFARAVPSARISSQPAKGLLPQVPTLFASGQPAVLAPSTHRIGSIEIVLAPVARWHWEFGDGGVLDTHTAGSRYPDRTVSHVYRSAGVFEVRLQTIWTATYTVDGQGPFTVDGSVTQVATARIEVGQGRAVLT